MADDSDPTPKPDRRDQARLAGAVIAVALIAALAFDNRHEVRIGYVIGDGRVRLIWLLLVTAILGAIAGRLVQWRRRR